MLFATFRGCEGPRSLREMRLVGAKPFLIDLDAAREALCLEIFEGNGEF